MRSVIADRAAAVVLLRGCPWDVAPANVFRVAASLGMKPPCGVHDAAGIAACFAGGVLQCDEDAAGWYGWRTQ